MEKINSNSPKLKIPSPNQQSQSNELIAQYQLNILLVEDNEVARKVNHFALQKLGCSHVDLAETGFAAIEMAKINHYDIIFMDIGLPDIEVLPIVKTNF